MTTTTVRTRSSRAACLGFVAAGLLAGGLVFAAQATGQAAGTPALTPPRVQNDGEPPTAWMYFSVVVIGALVVGANLIPSKRGHQD